MKLKNAMCLCLVLTALSLSSFAQVNLTKSHLQVTGSDTSGVIPIGIIRMANVKLIGLQECWEVRDSLHWQTVDYEWLVESQNHQMEALKTANKLNQKIIDDKVSIIALQDKQLAKTQRQIKWLKVQRWVLVTGVALLAGKIIL